MRRDFAKKLHEYMTTHPNVYLLTADLGYGVLDKIRKDFPDRALNVGSSEMLMIGSAIGLAQNGFVPVCYSITPFLFFRPFELLRTYVNNEEVNIKLVGSGRDDDYSHDGFSHWAGDDIKIMKTLDKIKLYKPDLLTDEVFTSFMENVSPSYINLIR